MSVIAYTGLPGSGKSYGVVENVIIPAVAAGRHIVTNLPLKIGTLLDDYPKGKITTFDSKDTNHSFDLDTYPGAMWVIDEVHHHWPSGLKMNNVGEKEKSFFTEHRHSVGDDGFSSEIVLITQDLAQVAAFVRNLVEDTYVATKLSAVGMKNHYMVKVYQRAATGPKPRDAYRTLRGTYKPEVFKYYRSHTKNKTDFAAGMEEKADDRANVWKNPLIRYGIPLAIVFIIFAIFKVLAYFKPDMPEQKQEIEETKPLQRGYTPVTQMAQSTTDSKVAERKFTRFDLDAGRPELSDTWRIVGTINDVFILESGTGTRTVKRNRCFRDLVTSDDICVISGRLVTWYSSKPPSVEQTRSAFESVEVL